MTFFKRQFCVVRNFSPKFIITFLNDLKTLPFNKKIGWHYDFPTDLVMLKF